MNKCKQNMLRTKTYIGTLNLLFIKEQSYYNYGNLN